MKKISDIVDIDTHILVHLFFIKAEITNPLKTKNKKAFIRKTQIETQTCSMNHLIARDHKLFVRSFPIE